MHAFFGASEKTFLAYEVCIMDTRIYTKFGAYIIS